MPGTLVVLGTRPDAIKLAPLIHALAATDAGAPVHVCATAQHREMLDPVLELFEIEPDSDLDAMPRTSGARRPDRDAPARAQRDAGGGPARPLVVQGDTTTAASAALAAFYLRIPVAHVEAGLRTGDMSAPWPEELNRRLITLATDMHFAPDRRGARQPPRRGHRRGARHGHGEHGDRRAALRRQALRRRSLARGGPRRALLVPRPGAAAPAGHRAPARELRPRPRRHLRRAARARRGATRTSRSSTRST